MYHIKSAIQEVGGMMLTTARITKHLRRSSCIISSRTFSSPSGTIQNDQGAVPDASPAKVNPSGFAKAFEKHSQIAEPQDNEQNYTFASLLRNSKLMDVSEAIVMITFVHHLCSH